MADIELIGSSYKWYTGNKNISSSAFSNSFKLYNNAGTQLGYGVVIPEGGYIYGICTYSTDYAYHDAFTAADFSKFDSVTISFDTLITTGTAGFSGIWLEVRHNNGTIVKSVDIIKSAQTNTIKTFKMDLTDLSLETTGNYNIYIGIRGSQSTYGAKTTAKITSFLYSSSIPDNPYDTWVDDYGASLTGNVQTGQLAKANDIKNLRQAVFYEMSRRANPINDYAGSIADQAPGEITATVGGNLSTDAGQKTLNSLLIINDFDNLVDQAKDMNILANGVSTNLLDRVKALGRIEKTAAQTGCRAACTGLCLGTCYTGCGNGCAGSAQVITINCTDCDKACSTNCGSGCSTGCYSNCVGSCGGGCASSCVGNCTGTCMTNCGMGCGSNCQSTCSGCSDRCWTGCKSYCAGSCKGGCYTGCGGTCSGTEQKPTAPSTSSCSGCSFGCKATCSTGCVNLTQ